MAKTKFTEEKGELMRSMWAKPVSNTILAQNLGVSIPTMIKWRRLMGLPNRVGIRGELIKQGWRDRAYAVQQDPRAGSTFPVFLTFNETAAVKIAAELRDIDPEILISRIVRTVLNDKMIDAVLDDADDLIVMGEACHQS